MTHGSLPAALLRPPLRPLAAMAVASGLVLLSAAPGVAAEPVARASATGLVLTVANTPNDSGSYVVTNDGTRETATGSNAPVIGALGGQSFITVGTLAQDAATTIVDERGRSVACAGLAGDGATLVSAADGGACLSPGDNATVNAGTIDLSGLTIVQADALAGLDQQLQAALQPVLSAVLPAVSDALATTLSSLGDLNLVLDIGAIQSRCSAAPGTADGDADIVDSGLYVEVAGNRVDLVSLPVDPPPNTKVLTDLDVVVTAVVDGVEEQLATGLGGALAPVGPLADQLEQAINDNVVSVLSEQLAPLEDNLLDGTLNKQVRPTRDSIEVTALDLSVLPAAEDFGVDLLSLEIGRSACGPSGRVAAPPTTTPTPEPEPEPGPNVPTRVPAGLAEAAPTAATSDGSVNDHVATGALAVLGLLACGAGVAAYRRVLR